MWDQRMYFKDNFMLISWIKRAFCRTTLEAIYSAVALHIHRTDSQLWGSSMTMVNCNLIMKAHYSNLPDPQLRDSSMTMKVNVFHTIQKEQPHGQRTKFVMQNALFMHDICTIFF